MTGAPREGEAAKPTRRTIRLIAALSWTVALGFAALGAAGIIGLFDGSGSDAIERGMSQAFGTMLLLVGGAAIVCLLLARRWRGWLIVAGLIIAGPAAFFGYWSFSLGRSEARYRQEMSELHAGKYHFGDQPALFAVAQAIANNDADGIRAAAKNVPDLNAPGRGGMTLLNFAVTQSWQRPQLVAAVAALLEAGADPNYANEHQDSHAMAHSVHASTSVLRTMLDAGGNPNAVEHHGRPMIFGNWYHVYFENERRARLELLLDRGLDINATIPPTESTQAGYTLLLYRASLGRGDRTAYADALLLLERGADAKRTANDGTTFAQLMQDDRTYYSPAIGSPPPEFEQLWAWLVARGLLPGGGS